MSVPQRPNADDVDATQAALPPADDGATIAEGVPQPPAESLADQTIALQTLVPTDERTEVTLVLPQDNDHATIALPLDQPSRPLADDDGTLADVPSQVRPPESADQTLIEPAVQNGGATIPQTQSASAFQATAGSSTAARGWAQTKGATGPGWAQTLPGSGRGPATPQRPLSGPRAEDRYRLLDNFAHGGLGNIWRAEDTSIHREIAFKELLPKALKNRVIVERFLEEAQITGQLEHPGIVPIYDVGYQENGTPFYAMKLLKGGNMDEAIESLHAIPRDSTERQLAFTRLLRQFIAVCQAVGFAHEKGVLHRDLKPLNVMLGQFGETLVLDWGLAKVVDVLGGSEIETDSGGQLDKADPNASVEDATIAEGNATSPEWAVTKGAPNATAMPNDGATSASATNATSAVATSSGRTEAGTFFKRQVTTDARTAGSQTMMGQIMGTPAYMPPEQALGQIDKLDARTDIYSLGGILYKLLTNQQPIGRGKAQEVLKKVIAGDVVPPRTIDPTIAPPLEAICRKAMSVRQEDRYAKALDLAADVEAWLADEPVSVFPDPWHEQFRRWRKRHRTLVFSSSVAFIVIVVGTVAWNWLESNRIGALRLAAQSKVDAALTATKEADLTKAKTLLAEALGQVRAESQLTLLRDRIQSDLDNVDRLQAAAERERLADLQSKATRLLDEAQQTDDLTQARTLLTEAATRLANETSLADLHRQATARLAEVNQALAQQSEVDAAKTLLAKFTATVEQVRVHGSDLSGEDSMDDLREAYKLGLAGLELFAIDFNQPETLDPQLTLLGAQAIDLWRDGAFELLFTVAQAEINLAIKDQPENVAGAAQRSLDRLTNAERLGRQSPAIASLKSELFDRLGKADESQRALKVMSTTPARTRFDHFFLGELARLRHDFSAALTHYQDALQVDPDDYWSLNMIGYCHMHTQQARAAAAAYTACIARRPEVFWPYTVRGIAFSELGQHEQAKRDFDKALELAPQPYYVFLNRGVVAVKRGDFDAAKADFDKAAELRPDLSAPHENLADLSRIRARALAASGNPGDLLRAKTEFQTALAELTKAIPLAPQQATLYHSRGMIRVALVDPAAALEDFQRAIRLSPNPLVRAAAFREIGEIHQRAKRLPEALQAFNQSLTQNPLDPRVIRERAEVLLSLGQYAEAAAGFTEFLEKDGPVGDVYRARGLAFTKLGKTREAINDYTMSLQYEPSPNMLKQRGKAYLLQATQLAKEDFEESLRLNPIDPDAYWGLAYAKIQLGDHADGVAEIEKSAGMNRKIASQVGAHAWPLLFNPATAFAQAAEKASSDPMLTNKQRDEVVGKYVTRAVEWLTEAHRLAGPQFRRDLLKEINSDSALNPIRNRAEFIEALKSFETAGSTK